MAEEKDVLVPRRDDGRMALRTYRPADVGPFPTLLASSAYRCHNNQLPAYPLLLRHETGPIDW
jgi:predicted acyl esterase